VAALQLVDVAVEVGGLLPQAGGICWTSAVQPVV